MLWSLQVKLFIIFVKLNIKCIHSEKWYLRWKNDEIEAIRTNNPQVGNPLIIAVRHRGLKLRVAKKIVWKFFGHLCSKKSYDVEAIHKLSIILI